VATSMLVDRGDLRDTDTIESVSFECGWPGCRKIRAVVGVSEMKTSTDFGDVLLDKCERCKKPSGFEFTGAGSESLEQTVAMKAAAQRSIKTGGLHFLITSRMNRRPT